MTIIRAGLLNQSFGRVSGTCDGASAPGGLTFSGRGLEFGEQVEAASARLRATATVAMCLPRRAAVWA